MTNDHERALHLRNAIRKLCEPHPLGVALNELSSASALGIALAGKEKRQETMELFRRYLENNLQIIDNANVLTNDKSSLQ